jgi:two-component system KDP operon response regulator KdpE
VTAKSDENKIQIGELTIDLEARRVLIDESDLHLTRTEFAIMAVLASHLNGIVTHDELLIQVWGPEYRGSNHYLHTYLGRLRKKMGKFGDLLETVPGMGYNLHSTKII